MLETETYEDGIPPFVATAHAREVIGEPPLHEATASQGGEE